MSHVREHHSLLAGPERRVLVWMAERMPAWVNPDDLTALALLSLASAGIFFAAFRISPWAGIGVIVSLGLNWFGDSLDGTLARVRRTERPRYGFYVDHVADLAGTTFLLSGLACSGLMNPPVALTLLVAYLLVCGESYLATHASGIFRLSFLGFGPTELRIVLIVGVLKVMSSPSVSIAGFDGVRIFDLGGVAASGGLGCAFVISAVRNGRGLYKAEPLPKTVGGSRAA